MVQLRHYALMALMALAGAAQAKAPRAVTGQFDYYAVALSWSPSYCASRSDPDQCAAGRQLGFVLHGLWPQYESGYPSSCSNEKLPNDVREKYTSLFPSPRLIGHEWSKHGTCSGLAPAAYFDLSARLKEQLSIPAQYQKPAAPVRTTNDALYSAFKEANPALAKDGVLPFCASGGRFLRELHACYDKTGGSRSCSPGQVKRSKSSCGQASFLIQSVR
ncbi:ribonuclease [Massilia sp. CCM 8734]|uniref:ribonuclease T2 family protein n=1 Tax=Massilia sp. CCM 8734 TaxID=2609283 RepID=UPI001420FF40|nr:ribonuclease [Massilia sp. CCM 8734]